MKIESHYWNVIAVAKSGIDQVKQSCNLVNNVDTQKRGAVLAEAFSWAVTQGFTHVFIRNISQLYLVKWICHENDTVRCSVVR